ncbi:cytochrome c4 [Noviherbaspirillum cavernae]|uniref:Cytochrome c4 n=2 Tax=Noviherbaspirillum cavernae TaxID=2320862 RepID=A0A418X0T3_9BURK|nr:cytochrome c4 [Noviherbaspirillum cavernae]
MPRFLPSFVSLCTAVCALASAFTAQALAAEPSRPLDTDTMTKRAVPCMACHGKEGRAASDGYYPRIAGKPAGYLYNQLLNFKEGRRKQYPMMIYMVQHLSDDYLKELAVYFAEQHPPYPAPQISNQPQAVVDRGRTLAMVGDATKNIPSCAACHGEKLTGIAPSIPGLLGLPRDYINGQFGAWRSGARRAAAPDCMGEITQRLTVEDISAVSAWLASQPVPPDYAPSQATGVHLPIACGSFSQK